MEDYLQQLNEAQRAAVEYIDGPELVIAGAGSGKTRVLTYKIVHLLHQGFRPRHILALTFTNKAAREMRERIEALIGIEGASRLWMGTFHSIFSRILRMHADRLGFKSNFTIYDASDSKSLIKSIIKDLGLDDKFYRPGVIASDISRAKNALYSPEDYANDGALMKSDADAKRPRTAEIYKVYAARCRIAGAMDFDDLLYYTNVLLRDNPDILGQLQEYFTYVLVDEYQDTNFAQHLIIKQLCAKHRRLCVVGDDAQSIYSFRGANIRNILSLEKTFPNLKIFKLEQNYRSTKNIIGAANTLIAWNSMQIPKEVFSDNRSGDPVEVIQAYNDYEEAYTLASRIRAIQMRTHDPLTEFAVLYRTNAQSRVLEEALRNRNIPYRIYGGLSFYQRAEVKDAICFFRLAVNPDDDEALRRVINKPARGIGETTVKKLMAKAVEKQTSMYRVALEPSTFGLEVNRGTAGKLTDFAQMIRTFNERVEKGVPAPEVARLIMSRTKLLAMYISDTTPESISKRDNLQELIKATDDFASARLEQGGEDAPRGMGDFLAEVSLLTDQDEKDARDGDADTEKVTLMTIHAAKGLEFSNVFIVGAEEELLPSAMSRNSAEEIEEERRLMYVAITRAKDHCTISYASQRMVNGITRMSAPSRFIAEIDPGYLRPMAGTRLPKSAKSRPSFKASPYASSASDPQGVRRAANTIHSSTKYEPSKAAAPAATASRAAGASGEVFHAASELAEGMRIHHPRFFKGTILRVDTSQPDARIHVKFDDGSTRILLLKFARFAILP